MYENKKNTLDALKAILLDDDRLLIQTLEKELGTLKAEVLDPSLFGKKVAPHTTASIDSLRQNFGVVFKEDLKVAVQRELKESQDDLINALYPIMGKLIRKFIQSEMEKLAEEIDKRLSNSFDLHIWMNRIKAFFAGTSPSSIILSEINAPEIEEIFVIQAGSGLLIGSYTRNHLMDQDMIAGMMSAITSFVEDAFQRGQQSLQTIEYDSYKILFQPYQTFSMAFVISGVATVEFKSNLQELTDEFVTKYMNVELKEVSTASHQLISTNLASYFIEERRSNKEANERDK